jgi:hypothetical protein
MNCEQANERFLMQLGGEPEATAGTDAALRAHLESCDACRESTAQAAALWSDLGALPDAQPSPTGRLRFDAMLAAYKHGARQAALRPSFSERFGAWLEGWWPQRPALQFGIALSLLAIGVFAGARFENRRTDLAALRQEVQSTRAMVALSLLQQRSPADRLQGIAWTSRVDTPNDDVLTALLATLDTDTNINVRLAAVDALASATHAPRAREGLRDALPRQTSPLVQIAVMDALVQLHETSAMETFRTLADDIHADPTVRKRAQWALQQLTS